MCWTPLVWVTAPLGIIMCLFMMGFLPLETWLRLAAWTAIGLVIYYFYSSKHAKPSKYGCGKEPGAGIMSVAMFRRWA